MPVRFPQSRWPVELLEEGPDEDPSILLSGGAEIGGAPHRVLAVRVGPSGLQVDFRAELDEDIYADYSLEVMLEELSFFENVRRSALVRLDTGNYIIWMVPSAGEAERSSVREGR